MKFLFVFLLILVSEKVWGCKPSPEETKKIEMCREKYPVTEDDWDRMLEDSIPDNPKISCYFRCILENIYKIQFNEQSGKVEVLHYDGCETMEKEKIEKFHEIVSKITVQKDDSEKCSAAREIIIKAKENNLFHIKELKNE